MNAFGGRLARALGAALVAVVLCACDAPRPPLAVVPSPDASRVEPSVRRALADARSEVERLQGARASSEALAAAYGELGMTYQAHNFATEAEAAYRNAQQLAPGDRRWPYLRGHVLRDSARGAEALAAFEAALAIAPGDAATLQALGTTALQQGRLDRAQQAFERLRDAESTRAAGLAGLGKVALARRDARTAVAMFEAALQLAPGASRLRHPLAMALRDAGEKDKAEAVLRGFAPDGAEPGVPDPLVDVVAEKSATAAALVRRGQRYGREGRFDLAAQAFAAAAESRPTDAATLANLGISLANVGRLDEAQAALGRAIAIDPSNAVAQTSLGLVHDRQGRDAEAAACYEAALRADPGQHDARLYLADARMRSGEAMQAVRLYRDAMTRRPSPRVRLSLSFALIRAGQWRDAKAELERGRADDPSHAGIVNALVRVLAAAPDDTVRDGARAVQLGAPLYEATQSPDVGASLAMAYAETGRFDRATELQQQSIAALQRMRSAQELVFPERLLARYREHRPAREPWPAEDAAFQPRSPAAVQRRP